MVEPTTGPRSEVPSTTMLPMAPSCALDESGLHQQLERYRRAGEGARVIERSALSFEVELGPRIDVGLVEEAIAIERECCPFFTLEWNPEQRRLTVSVSQHEHEPALAAIAYALAI